ncbi:YegP family protein [Microlunatus ginsengisoli]|uniref:YegP family protein n=1 Tax=Microlunatus ginsengisoli TaxID=363863 RepID=UPI0031D194AC
MYRDAQGEFRWRLKSTNGRSIATSGEGYKTKAGVQNAIAAVRRDAAAADVDDQTATTF